MSSADQLFRICARALLEAAEERIIPFVRAAADFYFSLAALEAAFPRRICISYWHDKLLPKLMRLKRSDIVRGESARDNGLVQGIRSMRIVQMRIVEKFAPRCGGVTGGR